MMGVGEDPVGEDGMDIDAPAWLPADVEAADKGVIQKGDPGDFYMKVIAKKFRGVWHYGVITGVATEWVLEDYGGATQWRAVFEDGSGKVTVQSGWVMEDCLHHMETFSVLNAGPLFEEARVKAIMTESVRGTQTRSFSGAISQHVPKTHADCRGSRNSVAVPATKDNAHSDM
eukprot:jgi/Tetstr1/440870/TSEL_029143.t1